MEVREASLADLPVAFRWRRDVGFGLPEGPGGMHEVRFDGESLWEPFETVRHGGVGEPSVLLRRDARWLEGRLDHRTMRGDGDPLDLGTVRSAGRGPAPFIDEDPTVRSVLSSDLEPRFRQVHDAARLLLVAEGRLFRQAREPSYRLSRRHDEVSGWTYMPEVVVRSGRGEAGSLWRLDEAGQMATEHAMAPGHEAALAEVLVPEAVRLPLPEWAVARAARDVAFWLSGDPDASPEAGAPMRALREAVDAAERADSRGLPVDVPALAEALGSARPLMDRIGGTEGERARVTVDRALARYDARSMDFGLGAPGP